jgi:hypothetical protein
MMVGEPSFGDFTMRVRRRPEVAAGKKKAPEHAPGPLIDRRSSRRGLEHDPEKWIPVFRKIMLNQKLRSAMAIQPNPIALSANDKAQFWSSPNSSASLS